MVVDIPAAHMASFTLGALAGAVLMVAVSHKEVVEATDGLTDAVNELYRTQEGIVEALDRMTRTIREDTLMFSVQKPDRRKP